MNTHEDWSDFTDWAPVHLSGRLDDPVGILAGMPPDEEGELKPTLHVEISEQLEPITKSEVTSKFMDPSVGAGSFGVASFWQVVSQGADILAWAAVVIQVAPRIKAAAVKLARLRGQSDNDRSVVLSPAAIRILVVADLIRRYDLEPSSIADVQILHHTYPPVEPREELRLIYAAYTVAVSAFIEDHYCTWTFLVTPTGNIVAESRVMIPVPNVSHWSGSSDGERSLLD